MTELEGPDMKYVPGKGGDFRKGANAEDMDVLALAGC